MVRCYEAVAFFSVDKQKHCGEGSSLQHLTISVQKGLRQTDVRVMGGVKEGVQHIRINDGTIEGGVRKKSRTLSSSSSSLHSKQTAESHIHMALF